MRNTFYLNKKGKIYIDTIFYFDNTYKIKLFLGDYLSSVNKNDRRQYMLSMQHTRSYSRESRPKHRWRPHSTMSHLFSKPRFKNRITH